MKAISLILVLSLVFIIGCEIENIPPTCEIISPGNGAEYDVGDLITISVDAADEDGTIEEVRFYIDDIGIFSASGFPFNYEWNTEGEEDGIKKIRVRATDDKGGTVDDEISILLNPGGGETGTLTDIDGNVYQTVTIGTQQWMAENLKTTKYNDGTDIPLVTGGPAWGNLTTPGYCWYDNDPATYGDTYGALYNWYTVETGNLCPAGWHVPTDAEWTQLTDYLGGVSVAGGKLKETGTTHWISPNEGATNESGFTALPGGYLDYDGYFYRIGLYGYWWSATESGTSYAWYRYLYYYYSGVYRGYGSLRDYGLSVRCLRD